MEISYNEIYDKSKIIDIRFSTEYNKYHIEGSKNIPRIKLLSNPEEYLNKGETYYIICSSGITSNGVCKILNALGYNCYSISGGVEGMKKSIL